MKRGNFSIPSTAHRYTSTVRGGEIDDYALRKLQEHRLAHLRLHQRRERVHERVRIAIRDLTTTCRNDDMMKPLTMAQMTVMMKRMMLHRL